MDASNSDPGFRAGPLSDRVLGRTVDFRVDPYPNPPDEADARDEADDPADPVWIRRRAAYSNAALANMRLQRKVFGDEAGVSLCAMYRECGEPAGFGPDRWVWLAAPLVEGLNAFMRGLLAYEEALRGMRPNAARPEPDETPFDPWEHDGTSGDEERDDLHREGDVMADEQVAAHYAAFLDGREEFAAVPILSIVRP